MCNISRNKTAGHINSWAKTKKKKQLNLFPSNTIILLYRSTGNLSATGAIQTQQKEIIE